MAITMKLGLDVIGSYKRLSYTPWHALAEFVDNSTQSYFQHRAELDAGGTRGVAVSITYDRQSGTIRIVDNAMGMSYSELDRCMHIGLRPSDTSGRSQYGMGLKTAACWLGNRWTVTTKRFQETTEHSVTVDVRSVGSGNDILPYESTPGRNPSDHYTVIDISDLNRSFQGRTIGKIRDYMRSMYRQDFRVGVLRLQWNDEPLTWEELDDQLLVASDGAPYKRDFLFTIEGKRVSGWVGILERGSRSKAGFSVLHRDRVIRGWPDSWRPETIFGQFQGSNDLVNQRLVGEVHLDDFDVSHTKDDILWIDDEEDRVQDRLRDECSDYRQIALTHRRDADGRRPSDLETQTAVQELVRELRSPEMVDLITLSPVEEVQVASVIEKAVLNSVKNSPATFSATIDESLSVKGYLTALSVSDPYVTYDLANAVTSPDMPELIVVINTNHPHWGQLSGSEGVLNYLRHCVYDAVAEWQAGRKAGSIQPGTIKQLKDHLLRLPMYLEESASN